MLGDLAEPGVCPVRFHTKWPMASVALFGQAKSPVKLEGKKPSADAQPSGEAVAKVEDGRLDGPLICKGSGKLSANGEAKLANTACRFSVQRAEKLRAADDLKRSSTNEATAIHTPIDLA